MKITGTPGNDSLTGTSDNDQLYGGDGNDSIDSGGGNDSLSGGAGDDTLYSEEGNDSLSGGAGNDTLDDNGGNDSLSGGAGNDSLDGREGNNTLSGGDGDDDISGGIGDTIVGGLGTDNLYLDLTSASVDLSINFTGTGTLSLPNGTTFSEIERLSFLFSGSGNDTIAVNTPFDVYLDGGEGNDSLSGGAGDDYLDGREGNDSLSGGAGNDFLSGRGEGNDSLSGGAGNDFLEGEGEGDEGNDTLSGGDGDDDISGGIGDTIVGGLGTDALSLDLTSASVDLSINYTGTGTPTLPNGITFSEIERLSGVSSGSGNDTIAVTTPFDISLEGREGNDSLSGGAGNDTLYGDEGNDSLSGDAGNDTLDGGEGNDSLSGGAGNDTLDGDEGNDTLTGGLGTDIYNTSAAFTTSDVGVDLITNDFVSGTDKILLDKETFTALTSAAGVGLSASEFATINTGLANEGSLAGGSSAQLVYNQFNGNLFYNPNGDLAGLATGGLFATLTGIPSLAATDFIVEA